MTDVDENAFNESIAQELAPPNDSDAGTEQSRLKQLMVGGLSSHSYGEHLRAAAYWSISLSPRQAVLKKTVGVKDLANLRLSLPANLLHPEGNLEYWNYLLVLAVKLLRATLTITPQGPSGYLCGYRRQRR